jgi:hypothetical protein
MEQPKRNKTIQTVVAVVVGVGAYFLVQTLFFEKPTFDKMMMEAASELNKTCPMMVDKETRLDNAMALPDNTFQYNYTAVNMVKDSVDAGEIQRQIEPGLVNNVKTNPGMKSFRENKVRVLYTYKDKNGVFLFQIEVTPDKYN